MRDLLFAPIMSAVCCARRNCCWLAKSIGTAIFPLMALRQIEDRSFAMSSRCKKTSVFKESPTVSIAERSGTRTFFGRSTGSPSRKGVAATGGVARKFQSGEKEIERTPTRFEITGRLKRSHGIETDNFKYLASVTNQTPKVCIPSPTILHMRGGRDAIDKHAYPDMEEFLCGPGAGVS